MAGKLTATAVAKAKEAGRYGDGGGLYLLVRDSGAKFWLLRYIEPRRDCRRLFGLSQAAMSAASSWA